MNVRYGARIRLLVFGAALAIGLGSTPASAAANASPAPDQAAANPQAVSAGDWPQFHRDASLDGYNAAETTIGTSNVAHLGVTWTGSVGASIGYSSPVVAGGVVYVGATNGKLYAFAAGCKVGGAGCSPLWTAATGGIINSAPAVSGGVVYVTSMDGKLYAFDAAGATQCATASGAKTCKPLWTGAAGYATSDGIWGSPTISGTTVYVGSQDGRLSVFSLNSTTQASACTGSAPARTCKPIWTAETGAASPMPVTSAPAVANGVVYVASTDDKLYALDAAGTTNCSGVFPSKTCQPLWTGDVANWLLASPAIATPTTTKSFVYVADVGGSVQGFDALGHDMCGIPGKCSAVWEDWIGSNLISASPAVANGVVYVGSRDSHKLYAYDAYASLLNCEVGNLILSCDPLWTATTGGEIESSPAIANGVVYVGSSDGKLYAYKVGCGKSNGTCTPLWTFTTGGAIQSSPAISNGVVYVGSNDGKLYAFKVPGAATHLGVSTTTPYVAGSVHSVTVTALDTNGNVANTYTGKVHFTSSDAKAVLPADYTFTAADKGVHRFNLALTLKTVGSQWVRATDTATATILGTQTITVTT